MTKRAVTAERFAKGMTFDEYVTYVGSPENLAREGFGSYHPDAGSVGAPRKDNSAVFRERYVRARLTDHQTAAIKWLVAQPGGPANILVISEDWSSDCRRDVPVLARLAEAGGLGLRIFNRDGKRILWMRRPDPAAAPDANYDLMLEFMNVKDGGEWASLPAVGVYTKDFQELCRYIEYPSMYHKDRIRAFQQAARPGESAAQTRERAAREFAALQASPFFDVWASAAIDEVLSALHERLVVGPAYYSLPDGQPAEGTMDFGLFFLMQRDEGWSEQAVYDSALEQMLAASQASHAPKEAGPADSRMRGCRSGSRARARPSRRRSRGAGP